MAPSGGSRLCGEVHTYILPYFSMRGSYEHTDTLYFALFGVRILQKYVCPPTGLSTDMELFERAPEKMAI
jgi:hypothetical protein